MVSRKKEIKASEKRNSTTAGIGAGRKRNFPGGALKRNDEVNILLIEGSITNLISVRTIRFIKWGTKKKREKSSTKKSSLPGDLRWASS